MNIDFEIVKDHLLSDPIKTYKKDIVDIFFEYEKDGLVVYGVTLVWSSPTGSSGVSENKYSSFSKSKYLQLQRDLRINKLIEHEELNQ